jgi:ubiquinone/menaquinone biosynthesis C-methylase UbiE
MRADTWSTGGDYEAYIGRWCRLVADAFLVWLAAPPRQRWLDVGCGTGVLTQAIIRVAEPSAVTGIDPSEAYVGYARASMPEARGTFSSVTHRHCLRNHMPTMRW